MELWSFVMACPKHLDRGIQFIYLSATLITTLFSLSPAMADEVFMINGDRISGEIVRQEPDVLKLKTSYPSRQFHEVVISWYLIKWILIRR
jgi:hypothetical protein